MLTLFPDEQIVTQSGDEAVTLTSHRIHYEYKEVGRAYNQSIMLEHITSCEAYSQKRYSFLIIAGVSLVIGIASTALGDSSPLGPAVAFAAVFAFLYWLTAQSFVVIGSPSTQMRIRVKGMKQEQVNGFINKVEQAKHQRVLALNNRPNAIV